jgi:hypothetical protein
VRRLPASGACRFDGGETLKGGGVPEGNVKFTVTVRMMQGEPGGS